MADPRGEPALNDPFARWASRCAGREARESGQGLPFAVYDPAIDARA